MATLNTLRTKGGIIVTIVIGISLIAFLLGDLSGTSVFNPKLSVGEIAKNKISYNEYVNEVDYLTNINKTMSGSDALSQEQQDAVNNYAWERLFSRYSLEPGYEKLGIAVSDAEMFDLIYGGNISPVLLNAGIFNDQQTGIYNKALVKNFVTNLNSDATGRYRAIWNYLQDQVASRALVDKYISLISRMIFVTDLEAAHGVAASNDFFDARYVTQPYESIADSLIKVTNADIKDYYNKHINSFRQVASRDIEYVEFEVQPSEQDFADAKNHIESLAEEFAVAENPEQFAVLNSQSKPDTRFFSRSQLPADLAEFAFTKGKNGMFGPVIENNTYILARVAAMRSIPDTMSVRQMFIAPGSEKLADSLVGVLNKGGNFNEIASVYSPGEANVDMGKIETSTIPPELLDEILATPKGNVTKIDNPNGTMIIDVYWRGPETPKVQLSTIRYDVVPSNTTQQAAYAKATGFAGAAAGSYDNFNKAVAEDNHYKRVARIQSTDKEVNGLPNSKELVRWAFNAKEKQVSDIIEIDGNYVIAAMISAKEDGIAPLSQVSSDVAANVRRDKKAEILINKMSGASSVDELAEKLATQIGEVEGVNFNAFYVPSLGVEPAVIGVIAGGVEPGAISKPIKGATGVFVVNVTSKNTVEGATIESERVRIEAMGQNYIDQRAIQAIREMSNIKDSRVQYF